MTAPAEKTAKSPAKLEQKKYVVAFLDFLGASEKMKSEKESDEFLQKINEIYKFIRRFANKIQRYNIADIKARIFSDNIVFAQQVDNKSRKNNSEKMSPYFSVIAFAYTFMFESMKNGLWVRGAITIGDFAINGNFIYGNALVRAYELENSSAIYPRILIDHKLIDFIKNDGQEDIIKDFITVDLDGEYCLKIFNELSDIFYMSGDKKKMVVGIGNNIRLELLRLNSETKKRQKFYWLANKFNTFCDEAGFPEQKIMLEN